MKKNRVFGLVLICGLTFSICTSGFAQGERADLTEAMKKSLVYLDISCYGYEQYQPWKNSDLTERNGYGCAVGEYEVITTAWNVRNAVLIKARVYAKNEFIPAEIKVLDYESNLCLIRLDASQMSRPLTPVSFTEDYEKGAEVDFYYLSSGGHVYSGRGFLDRANVSKSTVSFERFLSFIVAGTSDRTGRGQVYFSSEGAIGIACWSNNNKEAGLVPAPVINRFLDDAADGDYGGFGAVGFKISNLLDPAMRQFLKMPAGVKTGAFVSDVYNLGTGSDVLKQADVILTMDGHSLNPYGRFLHPEYDRLSFAHLITSKHVGETVEFEVWRDGGKIKLEAEVKNFAASEMLVPYYEFAQPEYIVTAGYILQKLTRQYMAERGDGWTGKVSPHIYNYYRSDAFKPTDERRDIVVLSYVLPADINLGYKDLGQIVLEKFNGKVIRSIEDVLEAQKLNPDSEFDVLEFEMDNPVVVIPRKQLKAADMMIGRNYGVRKLVNVNEADD